MNTLGTLNEKLDEGKDVGVFVCRYEGGCTYDIVVDGDGQNPVCSIEHEDFLFLRRNNYLAYPQCTKVGCHWFYAFTKETRNGLTLHNFYTYDDFEELKNKQFYIVPRNKSRVFFVDPENRKYSSENNKFTNSPEYELTKIKEHATTYTLENLFEIYCNPIYNLREKHYYFTTVDCGWSGGRREIEVQSGTDFDIEQKDGTVQYIEKYCYDFDLLSTEDERFRINDIFYEEERWLANLGDSKDEDIDKKVEEIKNNKNNFFVTTRVKSNSSFWSMGTPSIECVYLHRDSSKKPFEIIDN